MVNNNNVIVNATTEGTNQTRRRNHQNAQNRG